MKLAAMMDSPLVTVPHKPLSFGPAIKREETALELFPEKVSTLDQNLGAGKSLAERIQEDDMGARELFPDLLRGGGSGRRRRRKAEDHF
jgi:hypothetical protein